jgi:hypothetical protein
VNGGKRGNRPQAIGHRESEEGLLLIDADDADRKKGRRPQAIAEGTGNRGQGTAEIERLTTDYTDQKN